MNKYNKKIKIGINAEILFEIKSELNIISQTPNIHHICLFKESKIFNKHLDPNKLKITLSPTSGDENVIYANSYTGCFAFSTKTQSSINGLKVIYDGKEPTISISIKSFSASSLSFTLKEFLKLL